MTSVFHSNFSYRQFFTADSFYFMTILISFFFWPQLCNGQVKLLPNDSNAQMTVMLLNGFDFDGGGFSLLGHQAERKYGAIDTIGDFFIDDKEILNIIQAKWKFPIEPGSPILTCEHFYFLDICKNGQSLKSFCIKDDCKRISTSKVDKNEIDFYYHNYSSEKYNFNETELLLFQNKFKKAFKEDNHFPSLDSARQYLKTILNDSNLIMVEEPSWIEFDGAFVITYNHKLKFRNYEKTVNSALTNLSKEIKRKYPDETFFLDAQGIGEKDMVIEIYCNKSLSDKFNLYPIECCKWGQFNPILRSYWKSPSNDRHRQR